MECNTQIGVFPMPMSPLGYDQTLELYSDRIDYVIELIIANEGGYVNLDADKGRATKYGITTASWSEYRINNKAAMSLPISVKDITKEEALVFYQRRFKRSGIWMLRNDLWYGLFDWQVHSGSHAIKALQRILRHGVPGAGMDMKIDGKLGPITAKYVGYYVIKFSAKDLIYDLSKARIDFYFDIVRNDNSQYIFLNGWTMRAIRMIEKYRLHAI